MINYLAILVVSIIGYIIPMLWYSEKLFGKSWKKLSGIKDMKPTPKIIIGGFILTIIFNAVIAIIIELTNANDLLGGLFIGFILWLGFIATTLFNPVLYKNSSIKLYLIDAIPMFISMLISGAILGVWR